MNSNQAFPAVNPADYINTTAFFGEIKKTILSGDFKGGTITNIFGATKLDFTHADMTGVAVLDISMIFGEIKIRVPDDWQIEIHLSQLFTVADDKRKYKTQSVNGDKVLVLKGISVFANIEIVGIKR